MTVRNPDREAIRHGKITTEALRQRPAYPTWAMKLTMAITGLIFGAFVLVHMIGNLKIFMPDYGPQSAHPGEPQINVYGEFLREMGAPIFPHSSLLWIVRIVLLVALVLHIYCAFALTARSHKSRGKFRRTNLMGGLNSFTTRSMLITGIVLLAFIIFHILDLTLGVAPAAPDVFEHGEVYANMVASFSRWPVAIWYIIANLVLFLHLSHGIWLAVSDLGITGRRWRSILLAVSYIVPAAVLIGNIIIPFVIAVGWVS
ncbi:succinate dehydrogenase cytochrome b subunit [Corynebacterium pacaense]|uniref:succinate dehydrogenase cytochrome b subunit n=1 Tax=Corynebacterium pacaense TaxID=1816684 RepID=UPI0009BB3846|nr:succinate dehydrogenase cytochrome b subunit [Corynebacterium pacaense]